MNVVNCKSQIWSAEAPTCTVLAGEGAHLERPSRTTHGGFHLGIRSVSPADVLMIASAVLCENLILSGGDLQCEARRSR